MKEIGKLEIVGRTGKIRGNNWVEQNHITLIFYFQVNVEKYQENYST